MSNVATHPFDIIVQPAIGLGLEIEELGGDMIHSMGDCLSTGATFSCGSCPYSTLSCGTSFATAWSTGS